MLTEVEPSAKALAGLIRRITHDRIRALFLENVGRDVLPEQVTRETGVRIGGQFFSIDMIRHTTRLITAAVAI